MNEKKQHKSGLLLSSQTESKHFFYSDNPGEDLDLARLLDGKSDCYRFPVPTQTARKKHIIITDTSFVHGLGSAELRGLWLQLLRESFEMSVWTGELSPVSDAESLDLLLCNAKPVNHENLRQILAEKNIASDSCYFAGTGQSKALLANIFDLEPDFTLPVDRLLELPEDAMLNMLDCIPDSPQTGLRFVNPDNIPYPLFSDYLSRQGFADFECHSQRELELFLQSCPALEKLVLRMTKPLENIPAPGLPASLKYLDLQHAPVSLELLAELLQCCPGLEALKLGQLKSIQNPRESIALKHLSQLLQPGSRLKILHLQHLDNSEDHKDLSFLASLKDLKISNGTIFLKKQGILLASCPNLETLALTSCMIGGIMPQPVTLPFLTRLDLTDTKMHMQEFIKILEACPRLEILTLNDSYIFGDLCSIHLPAGLRCLDLSSFKISGKQINALISPCKKLERLDISYNYEREDTASIVLPASLTSLNCSGTNITGKEFAALVAPCIRLQKIYLSHCAFLEDMSGLRILETLTYLDLLSTCLSREQYARFLQSCPRLEILNMANTRQLIEIATLPFPKSLRDCDFSGNNINAEQLEGALPSDLMRLAPPSHFTENQLEGWINAFPHLQVLELPQASVSLNMLTGLKNKYPGIRIECPGAGYHKSASAQNHRLDTRTGPDNDSLTASQHFDYKENQLPHPASYRKQVETAKPAEVEPLSHEINRSEMNRRMRDEARANPKLFSGRIRLPFSNNWIPLPGLTCKDRLRHVITNPKIDLSLGYSESEALYYVKPATGFTKPVELSFIIEADLEDNQCLPKAVDPEYSTLIQGFYFNEREELEDNIPTARFRQLPQESQIAALKAYFDQFREKPLQNPGTTPIDLLNAILREKAGVCRHRTLVFLKIARALNIPARGIFNDIHAFVEVLFQGKWQALDLGGGFVNLTITPLPAESKPLAVGEKEAPKRWLAADNPFRTWDSVSFSAADMAEYAEKLLQAASALKPGSQNVLTVLDGRQMGALYTEIARKKKSGCHFIADLDDIRDKAGYIDNEHGEARSGPSALRQFLEQARVGDVLLTNWTDYDNRHVGYNSMMDNPRKIKNMLIPEGVLVLGILDQKQVMAEDFYSRFRCISKMPVHLPAKPLLPESRPVEISAETCSLDFYDEHWQARLLGQVQAEEGRFHFAESPFVLALLAGYRRFVFRHAPWQLPEFCFFMTQLLTRESLEVNGRHYPVPKNFKLLRDDSPYPLFHPECTWQAWPCALPEDVFLVNSLSIASLFQGYMISASGKLDSRSGLLARHRGQKLSLFITENLSDLQWAKILLHAREVTLELLPGPGVALPRSLQAKQGQGLPATASLAQCIVSNDVDFAAEQAAEQIPEAFVITVHEKTTGSDLLGMHLKTGTDPLHFVWREGPLMRALGEGKAVIIKGSFSPALTLQLESLFLPVPYLHNNGKHFSLPAGAKCIMIRKDPAPAWIAQKSANFSSESYWSALQKQFPPVSIHRLKSICKVLEPQCHFGYTVLQGMLAALNRRPLSNPLKSFLRLQPNYPLLKPLLESIWKKNAPAKKAALPVEEKRQRLLESVLKDNWYAFVAGDSGVGKSTTIHKILKAMDFEIVRLEGSLEEQLIAWLVPGKKKALFIDEANLFDAAAFDLLEGLYENPPRLLVKGIYYPVPPENRLVFAGNFGHFPGRQNLNFIARHGNIITFKAMTEEFLQENIIRAVCIGLNIHQSSETEVISRIFLKAFYHINAQSPDNPILTPRNLQMMVLRYAQLRKDLEYPEQTLWMAAYEELAAVCKPAVCKNLALWIQEQSGIDVRKKKKDLKEVLASKDAGNFMTEIKTRVNPVRILNQLMHIRAEKIAEPALAQAGSNGLLVEGSPGIGKSYLALEYLRAQGFGDGDRLPLHAAKSPGKRYYHLQGSDSEDLKIRLRKAFHEGAVVIIDEINTLPLEYILNALLSGKTPEGENPQHPGFFVIATQNPISFGKRQALSEAFSNRFQKLLLKDYSPEDLTHITKIIAKTDRQSAETLVNALTEAQQFAKQHHFKPEPTPRDLFEHAKHQADGFKQV